MAYHLSLDGRVLKRPTILNTADGPLVTVALQHTDQHPSANGHVTLYRLECTGDHARRAAHYHVGDLVHFETNRSPDFDTAGPRPVSIVLPRTVELQDSAPRRSKVTQLAAVAA